METSPIEGARLLMPYVGIAAAILLLLAGAVVVYMRPLVRALASLTSTRLASSGVIALCLLAATLVLTFFAAIELIATCGFAVGISVNPFVLLIAAVVSMACLMFAARSLLVRERVAPGVAIVVATCTVLFGLSLSVAGHFFDVSWDGNWYQQQAMLAIGTGWNPLSDPRGLTVHIGAWNPDLAPGAIWDFAVTHYSKGGWIRQAAFYNVTQGMEYPKAINLVLMAIQFLVWFAVGLTVRPRWWRRSAVLGLLMTANPVIVVQALSYKNDGHLGSLFTIATGLGCLVVAGSGGWVAALALFCSLMMLATIKFTGLVYSVILAAGFAAAYLWLRRTTASWRVTSAFLLTLLVITLFVGYNPYIQNTLDHGTPFHPLMGAEKVEIISNQWPSNFPGTNRVTRLALSLFSKASDESILAPGGDTTHLKLPFTLYKSELRPYLGFDTRVAGFGPLFSGALVLAFVLAILLAQRSARSRDAVVMGGLWLVVLLMATILVNPESWWARYAPQIWLVVAIVAGLGMCAADTRVQRALAVALCAVLLADATLVGAINFSNVINARNAVGAALAEIASWPNGAVLAQGDFDVTWTKLEERGLKWQLLRAGETTPTAGLRIPYTTTTAYPR